MAIESNFEFKGLSANAGYVKIASLSLHNTTPKKWIATISKSASKDEDILDGSDSVTFDYVEGVDPFVKAYELVSAKYPGVEV